MACPKQKGFALLEMALALVVLGILLGLVFTLMGSVSKTNREKKTLKRMERVEEALMGYLLTHGRLPYADADNDGEEEGDELGESEAYAGKFPYATLGLTRAEASDAYGRVFDYDVSGDLASNARLTDTTPYNICHQLGAYIHATSTATTHITVDQGGSFSPVAFVLLAPGHNREYEGENQDGDRDYEAQNPKSDDLLRWRDFSSLYKAKGCGGEFYTVVNNNGTFYVLGGAYSSCTSISPGEKAYISQETIAYGDGGCSAQSFNFASCEGIDFGTTGDRDTLLQWTALGLSDL